MGRKVQAVMRRADDGSAFITCDNCKKSIAAALADMHDCGEAAAFKAKLERIREDYVRRLEEAKAEKEKEKSEKKDQGKRKKGEAADNGEKQKKEKHKDADGEHKGKRSKDPDAPKKPPTSYFLFMEDFRKAFKEDHPESKGVTEVTKAGGEKWKSMSDEEKAPYLKKAEELKKSYKEALEGKGKTAVSANHGDDDDNATAEDDAASGEIQENVQAARKEGAVKETAGDRKGEGQGEAEPDQKRRRLVKGSKKDGAEDAAALEDELQDNEA